METVFEAGKWYDTNEYDVFAGPAQCLSVYKDSDGYIVGDFGPEHDNEWTSVREGFFEVPAPESEKNHADTLDEAIRIRNAAIDAATAQIKALMDYDKAIRVKEVIPADVRESIRIIFTRG